MCRRPLAYGHATATRILLGLSFSPLTGANDRESHSGHLGTQGRAAEKSDGEQRDQQESVRNARTTVVGRVVDGAQVWISDALRLQRISGCRRPFLTLSS